MYQGCTRTVSKGKYYLYRVLLHSSRICFVVIQWTASGTVVAAKRYALAQVVVSFHEVHTIPSCSDSGSVRNSVPGISMWPDLNRRVSCLSSPSSSMPQTYSRSPNQSLQTSDDVSSDWNKWSSGSSFWGFRTDWLTDWLMEFRLIIDLIWLIMLIPVSFVIWTLGHPRERRDDIVKVWTELIPFHHVLRHRTHSRTVQYGGTFLYCLVLVTFHSSLHGVRWIDTLYSWVSCVKLNDFVRAVLSRMMQDVIAIVRFVCMERFILQNFKMAHKYTTNPSHPPPPHPSCYRKGTFN